MALQLLAGGRHMEISVIDERREGAVLILLVTTSGEGVGDYSRPSGKEDDDGWVWPMFASQDREIADALSGESALKDVLQRKVRPYRLRIGTTAMPAGVLRFGATQFIARALLSFNSNERTVDLDESNAVEWGYTLK